MRVLAKSIFGDDVVLIFQMSDVDVVVRIYCTECGVERFRDEGRFMASFLKGSRSWCTRPILFTLERGDSSRHADWREASQNLG